MYASTSMHTSRVRTATGCRGFRQLACRIGRTPFNPHLCCGFSLLSTGEYRLPGTGIAQYRRFTLQGIFGGVVPRRRYLILMYIGDGCWHHFDLERLEAAAQELAAREGSALAQGQEVES
jgi:hypothetical protein